MRLRESRTPLGAVVLTTLLLNVLWPAVARGADEAHDLVLASHPASDTLDVEVACPPVVTFRGTFDAVVLLRNRGPEPRSVTRGALALHAGALRVTGPRAFSVSLTVPAAGADGTPGRASTSVPILAPPTALRGSVLSVGLGLFGPTGPSGRRHLLATGACTVEISTVDTPVLTRIEVLPGAATIAEGQTQGFVARGGFSDGSVDTPLAGVVWSSHAQAVATIGGTGIATGVGVGTAVIRASRDGVRSAEATLTVTPPVIASIAVSPPIATIDAGGTLQYHATATLTDGSTQEVTADVVWSSNAEAVARITAAALATGVGSGTATITARHASGVLGTATLTVAGAAGLPRIASVSPARGTSLGGTLVTVSGNGFAPGTTVRVGGVPATEVVAADTTVITARTPAGTPGAVADVTVENALGSDTRVSAFSYLFPFSIPGALAIATGTTGALTVSLVEPAAAATEVIATSADPAVATLPASATIGAGQAAIDIPVTAVATVSNMEPVKATAVTVSIGGSGLTTTASVSAPFSGQVQLTAAIPGTATSGPPIAAAAGVEVGLTLSGTLALTGGATHRVTLTLAEPAPAGGLCVSLASTNPAVATVPPPVCIGAGERSFSFNVTALASGRTTVSAVAGGEVFAFSVLVNQAAPTISEVLARPVGAEAAAVLLPTLGVGIGASRTVTLALAEPAPAGGLCATLGSNKPAIATVPAESCIAPGERAVAFAVTGVATGQALITVTAGTEVFQVSAFVNQAVPTSSEILTRPVGVEVAFALLPTVGVGIGASHTVTLALAAPAPAGGLCADLTSNNLGIATVPAQNCVAQGEQAVTFSVTGVATGQTLITVRAGSEVFQVSVFVNQAVPTLNEITARPVGVCTVLNPVPGRPVPEGCEPR